MFLQKAKLKSKALRCVLTARVNAPYAT